MSELKPCPFCGLWASVEEEDPIGGYVVRCGNCSSQTPIYLRADLAIKAWNKRAVVPGEVCEIEGHGEVGPLPLIEDDRTAQLESLVLEMRADIYGAMCDMFSNTPWGLPAGTVYDERIAALGLEVGE